MATPYTGQPFNIGFDPVMTKPLVVRDVQFTEADMKNPVNWLNDGIYCIYDTKIVTTKDHKMFMYIGRDGNATDIADATKWKRIPNTDDVQSLIGSLTGSGFDFKGNTATLPSEPVNKGMYRASAAFTLPAASALSGTTENIEVGDMLIAIEVQGANDTTVFKYSVVQNNIDTTGLVRSTASAEASGRLAKFNAQGEIEDTDIKASDLGNMITEFTGGGATTLPNNPAAGSLCQMINIFRGNGNKLGDPLTAATDSALGGIKTGYTPAQGAKEYAVQLDANGKAYVAVPIADVATESAQGLITAAEKKYLNTVTAEVATADETTFKSAINALIAKVGTKSFNVGLNIISGTANNFFHFVTSVPHVIAHVNVMSATSFKMHFNNYSLDGTSASDYVEYTYDSASGVLFYQGYIEESVS